MSYIFSKESFSYISDKVNPKKLLIFFQAWKIKNPLLNSFLYLGKWNFLTPSLKNFQYIRKELIKPHNKQKISPEEISCLFTAVKNKEISKRIVV